MVYRGVGGAHTANTEKAESKVFQASEWGPSFLLGSHHTQIRKARQEEKERGGWLITGGQQPSGVPRPEALTTQLSE